MATIRSLIIKYDANGIPTGKCLVNGKLRDVTGAPALTQPTGIATQISFSGIFPDDSDTGTVTIADFGSRKVTLTIS